MAPKWRLSGEESHETYMKKKLGLLEPQQQPEPIAQNVEPGAPAMRFFYPNLDWKLVSRRAGAVADRHHYYFLAQYYFRFPPTSRPIGCANLSGWFWPLARFWRCAISAADVRRRRLRSVRPFRWSPDAGPGDGAHAHGGISLVRISGPISFFTFGCAKLAVLLTISRFFAYTRLPVYSSDGWRSRPSSP